MRRLLTRPVAGASAALALALLLAGCDTPPPEAQVAVPEPGPGKVIAVVDISEQRLAVERDFDDGRRPETYQWVVSTGIERKPTPLGQYYPDFLSPTHVSSIYNVPMPWSVFFNGNIAIHGDPDTRLLGTRASNGCVRVDPAEAEVFYKMVEAVGLRNTTIIVRE